MRSLTSVLAILPAVLFIIGALLLVRWALRDARLRGKPGWAVGLMVLVSFPLGLLMWIVFRPPVTPVARLFGSSDR